MRLKTAILLTLPLLASACVMQPNESALCDEATSPARSLAALEAEMTDAVALAADELITVLRAGCRY